MVFVKACFWCALALWVGAVVFFSLIVAPAVFTVLPPEDAGRVVGAIFPRYDGLGVVAGFVAVVAAALVRRASGAAAWGVVTAMLGVMLAATLYAAAAVHPRAQALRPALHQSAVDPGVRAEFDRLHRRAVQLNGVVLLLGVAAICVAAAIPDRQAG